VTLRFIMFQPVLRNLGYVGPLPRQIHCDYSSASATAGSALFLMSQTASSIS
jgi:hypothetical protein